MQIGLALSGGGHRATVFHLGLLSRLASQNLLESITFISTVSGGSLCAGLVLAASDNRWPSSSQFREASLPRIRRIMTETDLQSTFVAQSLATGGLLRSRAPDLASALRRLWHIEGSLRDLPTSPRWIINATCYETGKNWRFERKRMGDYVLGYELEPDFPIADAMAASAGFPGLIGPLSLRTQGRNWVSYGAQGEPPETRAVQPAFDEVHLWDGGVYDILGVEPLFKPNGGYRSDIDFLIVSDASGPFGTQDYRLPLIVTQTYRLVGIAMDQVRSLRARSIVGQFTKQSLAGCYVRLGNSVDDILGKAGRVQDIASYPGPYLTGAEAQQLAEMGTDIRRFQPAEFDR